jgi:hypothetical protein
MLTNGESVWIIPDFKLLGLKRAAGLTAGISNFNAITFVTGFGAWLEADRW